nr:hypothetical protein [Akkermansiaceae bacterium]
MLFARLLVPVLAPGILSAALPYRFSLDGAAFDPKILPVVGERLGVPTKGDLGSVAGLPFVLQGPGHYRFRRGIDGVERSKVFCAI